MSLDELAKNPELVTELPREILVELYRRVARLEVDLRAQLLVSGHPEAPAPARDRLVDVPEAAKILNCSEDWIYRHQDELPVVRQGRRVKFSLAGLDAYIHRRQGRRP